jgi:hypothetical protein
MPCFAAVWSRAFGDLRSVESSCMWISDSFLSRRIKRLLFFLVQIKLTPYSLFHVHKLFDEISVRT